MALITKPDMEFIWASGGAIVEPSDVKKQTGWTSEVPPHQWENWIQNRQDNYLAHINQRGIPEWDGNTEYEAGGLSYVQGTNGVVYKSVAASGPSSVVSNPTTDATDTYWTIAFPDNLNSVRIDVASASTVNLTTAAPNTRHINITGTTNIAGFTVVAGATYFVRFNAALTLTNSASLVTQTGANILTAAGDTCIIRATAANVVEVAVYSKAIKNTFGFQVFTSSGTFIVPANVFKLKYKLWAGGGGGGGVGSTGAGGGGGGGSGGYSEGVLDVTPGQSVSVTIGAAGTAGAVGGTGGTGGTTTLVRSAITLAAASGGVGGAANDAGGAGGAAGAGTVGTLLLSGGVGGTGPGMNSIGGLGANSPGGSVQGGGFGQGGAGNIPGGGGAGTGSQLVGAGGAGARGQVNFEW